MRITVVGLGKIGLPLAVQYARKMHSVIGVDIDERVVTQVRAGIAPFPGEAFLSQYLSDVVSEGYLEATHNTSMAVASSDVVVVVVPLIVDERSGEPDFRLMEDATEAVATGLQRDTLVLFETTVPVGTTRKRLVPLLEAGSGLIAGKDFFVAFSPERVFTGRVFADLCRYPKLVGGVDEHSGNKAVSFYSQVLDFEDRPDLIRPNGVWKMESAESAELAKLLETTYRDVNIALVNQFTLFAEGQGIDIYSVIEACNSQPFSHLHRPGIAVGGHCIPVYPQLYLWNDPAASLVQAARETNAGMPAAAVGIVVSRLRDLTKRKVAVLGAAYRGGVKETAFSGVFEIVKALEASGARVAVHDPLFTDEELIQLNLEPFHRGESADVLIIQADHSEYRQWSSGDVPGVQFVLDGRAILTPSAWPAPVIFHVLGKPETSSSQSWNTS